MLDEGLQGKVEIVTTRDDSLDGAIGFWVDVPLYTTTKDGSRVLVVKQERRSSNVELERQFPHSIAARLIGVDDDRYFRALGDVVAPEEPMSDRPIAVSREFPSGLVLLKDVHRVAGYIGVDSRTIDKNYQRLVEWGILIEQ